MSSAETFRPLFAPGSIAEADRARYARRKAAAAEEVRVAIENIERRKKEIAKEQGEW
jgi:hypothetical protein